MEVDDLPIYYAAAILSGAVSYDAATGDSLTPRNSTLRSSVHRRSDSPHRNGHGR